jgi:hypothetical protein
LAKIPPPGSDLKSIALPKMAIHAQATLYRLVSNGKAHLGRTNAQFQGLGNEVHEWIGTGTERQLSKRHLFAPIAQLAHFPLGIQGFRPIGPLKLMTVCLPH